MEAAAVSYLNQHTRPVLELVKSGHTVEITDRGTPMAAAIDPAVTVASPGATEVGPGPVPTATEAAGQ